LNGLIPLLVGGSAEAAADGCANVTVANISGTVLLSMLDELLRITRAHGWLVLTGFTDAELPVFQTYFPSAAVSAMNEWRCVVANVS
jgi:ribosomal protein L11 methylase PrmA